MSAQPTRFSLFKRFKGYYYIRFVEDGRVRWKSTRCTTKSEALKKLTDFKELFKERAKVVSLAQFEKEFLEFAQATYAGATVDIFRASLRHLKAVCGDCALPSLTPRHIDAYKSKRLSDGVSPVSVNVELRALRTMMNVAIRWRYLAVNPFARLQQMRIPERKPAFLTRNDFQRLLNVVKEGWFRELIVFAALTGMRRGEVLNLRWRDVDLSRKLVHIETSATFKTKAGKSRSVPLCETVYQLLRSKAIGHTGDDLVFTRHGQQIKEDYVTHKFKGYVVKAGLDTRLRWHSLRHTFASWLVQDGVSLFAVQKLLGHSTSEVTQVYAHLQPEQLHGAVERLGEVVFWSAEEESAAYNASWSDLRHIPGRS